MRTCILVTVHCFLLILLMKPISQYFFLLPLLLLANMLKAENAPNVKTSLQLLCAEQMLLHIKEPNERAKCLGIMTIDYYQLENQDSSRSKYAALLQVCPQIEDKNKRYNKLLTTTNMINPILSKSDKKGVFNRIIQDSAGLSTPNKIALAQLAASYRNYDKALEIAKPIVDNRPNDNSGIRLGWVNGRRLDYALERIANKT